MKHDFFHLTSSLLLALGLVSIHLPLLTRCQQVSGTDTLSSNLPAVPANSQSSQPVVATPSAAQVSTQAAPSPSSNPSEPSISSVNPATPTPVAPVSTLSSAASRPTPISSNPTNSAASPSISNQDSRLSSIIIVTVTRTGSDGVVYTSLASSATFVPQSTSTPNTNSSSSSSSSTSTTWAIIGGVAGGLLLLGSIVFIVFRCTQRRFSDLDDEDVAIKWPELVTRTDDPSTLNPLAARPGFGHGVGDDEQDEKPRQLYAPDISTAPSDQSIGIYDQHHLQNYQSYNLAPGYGEPNGYLDDPYLGPSAAPQPFPNSIDRLGYEEGYRPNNQTTTPDLVHNRSDLYQDSTTTNLAGGGGGEAYRMSWDGSEAIPLTVVNSNHIPPMHHQS